MSHVIDTYLAKIDPEDPDPLAMSLAAQVIRDGGLVAFPTETVYGLGANALDELAVQGIFRAKQRPAGDPLIVHIDEMDDLQQVAVELPAVAGQLAERFWPGPLTLVLRKHPDIAPNVTAGQETVAVRMPAHPVAQELIRKANVPIAAPSANRFSRPSATRPLHVLQDLIGRVDVILDGGSTPIGVESTIVDLTASVPTLLRPGGVPLETLREVLPSVAFRPRRVGEDGIAPAPGTLIKHYSPDAAVLVYSGDDDAVYAAMQERIGQMNAAGEHAGVLALDSELPHFADLKAQIVLLGGDLTEAAANLFSGIRELDAAEVDAILVRAPEQSGLGLALYDRLQRAAEGHMIEV